MPSLQARDWSRLRTPSNTSALLLFSLDTVVDASTYSVRDESTWCTYYFYPGAISVKPQGSSGSSLTIHIAHFHLRSFTPQTILSLYDKKLQSTQKTSLISFHCHNAQCISISVPVHKSYLAFLFSFPESRVRVSNYLSRNLVSVSHHQFHRL